MKDKIPFRPKDASYTGGFTPSVECLAQAIRCLFSLLRHQAMLAQLRSMLL